MDEISENRKYIKKRWRVNFIGSQLRHLTKIIEGKLREDEEGQ